MKYLVILLLVVAVAAVAGDMKSIEVGTVVPSFSLKNYDGKEIDLKKVLKENKYTVLMFISTECPVSNAYNDRMKKLSDTYSSKGIAFVGINANKAEDVKMVAEHSKDKGFKFPVVKDPGNKTADAYAAQVTPETFVINPDGKLLYHGRIDDNRNVSKVTANDLADALDALLAGKTPKTTTAKAFGCTIKRVSAD